MSRILAIEPDPERGEILKRLVEQWVDADVVITQSATAAIAALAERGHDLILTSVFISPSDDVCLTQHLKRLPEAQNLAVLTVPPLVHDAEMLANEKRTFRSLFRRKKAPLWPAYDQEALAVRIKEALEESRATGVRNQICLMQASATGPEDPQQAPETGTVVLDLSGKSDDALWTADHGSRAADMSDEELLAHCGVGTKRMRAHRWEVSDLPWLTGVRLPWGLDVQLVNISSSGLLIESGARFMPGSSTVFRLCGPNKSLAVPARVVRSQVTSVDSLGVRYRAAAVFDRKLETLAPRPQAVAGSPIVMGLAGVLARVREQAARGGEPAAIRFAFEQGVLQLVTAREVRIRDVPVVQSDGADSVYFAVPTGGQPHTVLQAIFEPRYRPKAGEFEVLKQAAAIAAEVLRIEETAGYSRRSERSA